MQEEIWWQFEVARRQLTPAREASGADPQEQRIEAEMAALARRRRQAFERHGPTCKSQVCIRRSAALGGLPDGRCALEVGVRKSFGKTEIIRGAELAVRRVSGWRSSAPMARASPRCST